MQILSPPVLPALPPSAVALGNFDGIHLGHAYLLRQAVERARAEGLKAAVLTFSPHPQTLLKGKPLPMLVAGEERERKLADMGIEFLVYWPFTTSLMKMTPEEFARDVLVRYFQPRVVFVGFNFTFGYKASGTPELLSQLGHRYGFDTVIVPPVVVDGVVVSSTGVRAALQCGDIPGARKLLGHWPYVRGKVVTGDHRGTGLGFPTANLLPPVGVLWPAQGVYAAFARVGGGRTWPAVLNIGYKPTFGEGLPQTLEVHLLQYGGQELYGQEMLVEFRRRLRGEKKFNTPEELKEQIRCDVKAAVSILEETGD